MSAPDRPTREQVDAAMARTDLAATNRDWWRRVTKNEVVQDAVWLSAEVRVLRAELDALSDEDRAEQIAALIVDKVRAQVARTPQPAEPSIAERARAMGLTPRPIEDVVVGFSTTPRCTSDTVDDCACQQPAVPDGEDEPDWHNMRERLHTEIGAIVGVTPREERTGDADGDLIEMVRRAVWAPSPATAPDGEDVPARLDAVPARDQQMQWRCPGCHNRQCRDCRGSW